MSAQLPLPEFSFRSRQSALKKLESEVFDLLIIGGGITGAAVAREAMLRGLKVALVEKQDFAWGTSSRSSKLIHGGLRYLENLELGLVFEALSERSLLLRAVPHLVQPLKFFLPVYKGDRKGPLILSLGLWLYDLLALFRAPGFHKRLSKEKLLKEIPHLRAEGLRAGFSYYDARMADDVLAVETLRSAASGGAVIANYTEALDGVWEDGKVVGYRLLDRLSGGTKVVRAKRTVVCAGPWTDVVGGTLSSQWQTWLSPSKGVHLIFEHRRLPVPGALVMSHPQDGRISFVIPREDFGAGVTIVGTTDGATPPNPEQAGVGKSEVDYLLGLVRLYFPALDLGESDIVSAYVGVRPLMAGPGTRPSMAGSEGQTRKTEHSVFLQKVSREHHIGMGPGGTVFVAGGKYTTHRRMAEEIVDAALEGLNLLVSSKGSSKSPLNPLTETRCLERARRDASSVGLEIPESIWRRYAAEALEVARLDRVQALESNPEGFPLLAGQFLFAIRNSMTLRMEDFYLRRSALFLSRKDHGLPWAEGLSRIWAKELGRSEDERIAELRALETELILRDEWKKSASTPKGTSDALRSINGAQSK